MIILSAGHNPKQPGACNDEFCEHEIATRWIQKIHDRIEDIYPVDIVPTGSLSKKVGWINKKKNVDLALELHFNSNIPAMGCEALYYPGSAKGRILAETLCNGFEKRNLLQPNRGAKEGYYQMDRSKPIDYFLRKTKATAVILEPDFIYQKQRILEAEEEACYTIADLLLDYISTTLGKELKK